MDERERKIVDAALEVIKRYGVSRSTMSDFAAEAGISRRTLYSVFNSKEALLAAVIQIYSAETIAALKAGCCPQQSFEEKIDFIFNLLTLEPRAELDAMPHADDFISGFDQMAREAIEATHPLFCVALEECLAPHKEQIEKAGLTVPQLAAYLRFTTKGVYKTARNRAHAAEILGTLRTLLVSACK